jgi:hypothetical protein
MRGALVVARLLLMAPSLELRTFQTRGVLLYIAHFVIIIHRLCCMGQSPDSCLEIFNSAGKYRALLSAYHLLT